MKKGIIASVAIFLIIVLICLAVFEIPIKTGSVFKKDDGISFKAQGKSIYLDNNGKMERFEIKGVNMGSGYPGAFPNDDKISQETYYRWFEKIAQMNANTVRIYKLHPPEFYTALYKYNKKHDKKLYIIQTIDFPEKMMFSDVNISTDKGHSKLFKLTSDTIDAIHGNRIYFDAKSDNVYAYSRDVSPYVVGYLLGIEWDENFVEYISKINSRKYLYSGKYFKCKSNASPFESFLASWGDFALAYEEDTYNEQHLISFGNWAETDPFINDIKITDSELESIVDSEHLSLTDKVKNGFFVSYNIYPYYPLFLQYGDYTKYIDETGKNNPYRKYLSELVKYHSYPVVVSEYGVPSSRSIVHNDRWRNFSHGGLNENEQARAMSVLYKDIHKAGCAGSFVFSWQDEWYKRAWNEMTLSDPDSRAFWNNVQCAEQCFGILAFDPQKKDKTLYPDGDFSQWNKHDVVFSDDKIKLSLKQDEKYLHIMVDGLDLRKDKSYINIALDISPSIGQNKIGSAKLKRDADFIIQLKKSGKSALYIDTQYDVFAYSVLGVFHYSSVGGLAEIKNMYKGLCTPLPANKNFTIVARADNSTYGMLSTGTKINEAGVLKQGNGNPDSDNYNSNADFYIEGNKAEIRIPWQLLNFYNPPECKIIDNLSSTDYTIKGLKINRIYSCAFYDDANEVPQFGTYKLKGWRNPVFHERLKPVYYALQNAFGGVK